MAAIDSANTRHRERREAEFNPQEHLRAKRGVVESSSENDTNERFALVGCRGLSEPAVEASFEEVFLGSEQCEDPKYS